MWFVPRGGASTTRHPVRSLLLSILLLCAVAAHALPADASTITGASLATCEPGPCIPPAEIETVELESVSNDDGTTSKRAYGLDRPQNLSGRAPAVLVFYGSGSCGVSPSTRFPELAPANRFIVVYMAVPCERDNNWDKRNIISPETSTPDDEPYVNAVVNNLTLCPGQCVDPQRIYAAGMSSGGSMVADIMCDPQNSPLFRGYMIDSSSLLLFNGAPHCPSSNRSFFAMLALSDVGLDAGIYFNTLPEPHLDVPTFADWAANRLGCGAARLPGAIGFPVASTLTYTYTGPCGYASVGSPAVMSLGIHNGGHGWGCQDSDAGAPPNLCPTLPNPPGLDPNGLPQTNGLFVEEQFWNFVAQGASSSTPAPALADTVPPLVTVASPAAGSTVSGTASIDVRASDDIGVAAVKLELDGMELGAATATSAEGVYSLAWDTTTAANGSHVLRALATDAAGNLSVSSTTSVTVKNTAGGGGETGGGESAGTSTAKGPPAEAANAPAPNGGTSSFKASSTPSPLGGESPSWLALGDGYTAGTGNDPVLASPDRNANRCRRSAVAYTALAASRLGLPPQAVSNHACSGANIASLYRADRRDHEPSQLSWISGATGVVTLTIGWSDTSMSAAIARCGRAPARCGKAWSRYGPALASLGAPPDRPRSLRRLFGVIASEAPRGKVIVFGYPRPFPSDAPPVCRISSRGLTFTGSAMRRIDAQVARLDRTIQTAAALAHVAYIAGSYQAFAGHELCTRRPFLNAELNPDAMGQTALAALLARARP
jgi:hypothetical protein